MIKFTESLTSDEISKIEELLDQSYLDKGLQLIDDDNYQELDKVIEQRNKILDMVNRKEKFWYNKLLYLELANNDCLSMARDLKSKFPFKERYIISENKIITLLLRDAISFPCDAYVNSIHQKKLFKIGERSVSMDFINHLGENFIYDQIKNSKKLVLGDIIKLQHPEKLKAPFSYHIISYDSDNKIDLDSLLKGIKNVLDDFLNQGLKRITFISNGLIDTLDDRITAVEEEIILKIAETVVKYLRELDKRKSIEVYFNFTTADSLYAFHREFYWFSSLNPDYLNRLKHAEKSQSKLILVMKTKNPAYH